MTTLDDVVPDLNGTTCVGSMFFDVADTVGVAQLQVPTEVGIDGPVLLDLALCAGHAHLLRMGVDVWRIDTNLG